MGSSNRVLHEQFVHMGGRVLSISIVELILFQHSIHFGRGSFNVAPDLDGCIQEQNKPLTNSLGRLPEAGHHRV